MKLFLKYNLWSFFSIMLTYLFYDFQNKINSYFGKKIPFTIYQDHEYNLKYLKKTNWILIKNNIKNSINAKLRFLILKEDFNRLLKYINEEKLLIFFKTIAIRLKKITAINEIENFSSLDLFDPESLGNPSKYYAINLGIKIHEETIKFIIIVRDEMLLFPTGRISSNFLLKLDEKYYKKAFIELDKKIIRDGMLNWSEALQDKTKKFTDNFFQKNYQLLKKDDIFAYKLFIQYLFLLKLISRDKNTD